MYLFVFIFLLLSTLGLYTELYLLQAMRFVNNQKTVGEIMLTWHSGAYMLGKEKGSATLLGANTSCYLRATASLVPACTSQLDVTVSGRDYLPRGFDVANLQMPAVVYLSGGRHYLATYLPKETLGQTAFLGYTTDEIKKQIKKARVPEISYGEVVSGPCRINGVQTAGYWIMTGHYQGDTQICFPALAAIPVGSVAFISVL